jgi:hypothetical protein
VTPPTVHLNGTSGEHLAQAAADAYAAVQAAAEALKAVYPNGRDYYPQDRQLNRPEGTSHRLAVDQFLTMTADLIGVATKLQHLRIAIEDQVRERAR